MAKAYGPLLSMRAQGTVGHSLTYKGWNGETHVRAYRRPRRVPDRRTPVQLATRSYFATIVAIWHELPGPERYDMERVARHFHMSGFNYYVQHYTYQRPADAGNTVCGHSHLGVLT